jgi:integrase/recombinase XerD
VPLVRVTRSLPVILNPQEVDALTAALRTHWDRAMVPGGLRRCRVLGLRLGDLRVAERRVFHRRGQGRKSAAGPGLAAILRRGQCLS